MKDVFKYVIPAYLSLFLFFIFLFFGFAGCSKQSVLFDERQNIINTLNEELHLIKENINFVEKNKDTPWAEGDFEFYILWLKGLEQEKHERFAEATIFYGKAYKITRHEISSYEILLPLGRAYCLNGNRKKALTVLKKFLREATKKMSSSRPWQLTPEYEGALQNKMKRAEWLIDHCR